MRRMPLIALALAGMLVASPLVATRAAAQAAWVEAAAPEMAPPPAAEEPKKPSLWRRTVRSVAGFWHKSPPAEEPAAPVDALPVGPAMAPGFDTGDAVLTVAPANPEPAPPASAAPPAPVPPAPVSPAPLPPAPREAQAAPPAVVVVARLPRPRPSPAVTVADTHADAIAKLVMAAAEETPAAAPGPEPAAAQTVPVADANVPQAEAVDLSVAEGAAVPAEAPAEVVSGAPSVVATAELVSTAVEAGPAPGRAPSDFAIAIPDTAAPHFVVAEREPLSFASEQADSIAVLAAGSMHPLPIGRSDREMTTGAIGARPVKVILDFPYQTGSIDFAGKPAAASETPGPQPADSESVSPVDLSIGDEFVAPHELVRRLQSLQDRIAQGSTEAFELQRGMLDRIERMFEGMQPEVWQDSQNASALVTYVLSGGKPTVLQMVLESDALPNLDEKLMRGTLAYVQGRTDEAKEFFVDIDARDFPASMGSQLAIAQAALMVADNPKKAAMFLDIARLLSPGTLAEEAALRREILVAGELQDAGKFESLSRQYLQRFRHSVYAGNFRQRFAAALTRMHFIEDPEQFTRLDGIMAELEPDARLELFLVIARAADVQGKSKAAQLSADRAFSLASPGTVEAARATLYRAAATVVEPDGLDATLRDLKAVDQALLEPSDWALYDAVAKTTKLIISATETNAPVSAATERPADQQDGTKANPVIASAENAIKGVDALLGAQTR